MGVDSTELASRHHSKKQAQTPSGFLSGFGRSSIPDLHCQSKAQATHSILPRNKNLDVLKLPAATMRKYPLAPRDIERHRNFTEVARIWRIIVDRNLLWRLQHSRASIRSRPLISAGSGSQLLSVRAASCRGDNAEV
mmetsp:Transcript_12314/g.33247  ORF Transcript_12314/g.33247 Transcript_12314/m.33247 type:complete len:137 (+) Transcript_12314:790-1200(+)